MANDPNMYAPSKVDGTALGEREKMGERPNKAVPSKQAKRIRSYWREIERYKRATSDWHDEVKNIENLYLDEGRTDNTTSRRFALLWANVETMKPAVYAKLPNLECTRRFKDRDPVARTVAELMERAGNTTLELYGVDETFQMVRDDRLLGGRGQAWVRYEATIAQYEVDEGADDDPDEATSDTADEQEAREPELAERLKGEKVCVDYVHLFDFGHNVAQTWNDVWLAWRWVYKTREEVEERFGREMADRVAYNAKAPATLQDRGDGSGASAAAENTDEFCRICEAWDKRTGTVVWMTEGMGDEVMDEGEPPIQVSGFFPCPRPCYATKTSRSLIPRPDYIYYRDQAKEINDLTDKIGNMMQWLVVKAFTPAGPSRVTDPIEEVVRDNSNRELVVQVEDWQQFTEKGGISKLLDWMPLDMIIQAIQAAIQARAQLIQDVFQITGISDILRGQTDPNETLGAQELKAQTGSRRLRNVKDELARFCRDIGRMVVEVIAEKFEPETIAEITGYRYQPAPPVGVGHNGGPALPGLPAPVGLPTPLAPAMGAPGLPGGLPVPAAPAMLPTAALQQAPAVGGWSDPDSQAATFGDAEVKLMRDDRMRSYRIEVETDSTSQPNEAQDQERRTAFLNATGGFLKQAMEVVQVQPDMAPLAGDMLMFTVRGFRAGRGMEETIERTFAAMTKRAKDAAASPQKSPEQIKAEADAASAQEDMRQQAEKHAQDMQRAQQDAANAQAVSDAKLAEISMQMRMQAQQHEMRMLELERETELEKLKATNAMLAKVVPPAPGAGDMAIRTY